MFRKVLGALAVIGVFASCGTSAPFPKTNTNSTTSTGESFFVVAYSPASGTLPASVTATFNKAEINRALLAAVTHYNLVCGTNTYAASSVDSVTGYASVTINLPIITNLDSGSECTLWLSTNLQDTDGNPLGGTRAVTYRAP